MTTTRINNLLGTFAAIFMGLINGLFMTLATDAPGWAVTATVIITVNIVQFGGWNR